MKANMAHLRKTVLLSLLAGAVSASLALAADTNTTPTPAAAGAPAGGPGGAGGRGGGGGNFQGMRGGGFGLDDQQRQLIMESLQKDREAIAKLDEQLRAAQKELMQAVLAEKYDEKLVREKAELVAKLQTELTMLRSKALATVSPTLKPEQKQEMENSQLGAMFLTSGRLNIMGGFGGNVGMGGRGQRGAGNFDPTAAGGNGGNNGGRRGGGGRGGQGGGGGGRGGGGGGQP